MPGNVINVNMTDGIEAALKATATALGSAPLRREMGRAVRSALIANFEKLNAERHKNETGVQFYAGAARSVQQPLIESDGFTVAVTREGVAQRYYGGTITAGSNGSGSKWLTIPAIPAALGRRAGSFTNLKFVFFRDDLAALVSNDPAKARYKGGPKAKKERGVKLVPREDGKLPVVYWLKRSVTQKADPSVIPPEEELAATAYAEGTKYLREALEIEGGGAPPNA